MSQQEQQRGWVTGLAGGLLLLVAAAGMALMMVAGLLRTTVTGPDFSLLSLCLHGAGWEGGLVPGDPGPGQDGEEEPEESEDAEDTEEEPGGEDGEQESEDAEDTEEEPEGEDGQEESDVPEPDEGEEGGDGNEDGDGEEGDDEEDEESEVPSFPGPGEDGEGGRQPWWPDNPEDWASVLPDQNPEGTVVHTVSVAAQVPSTPAEPSQEELWAPEDMLELYKSAGEHWRMDWAYLASIGYHESRHGTDPNTETENEFGALGPMQFIPSAWEHHGVFPDGRSGTPPLEDRMDATTAVWSAANKLTDQGIRESPKEALHAYNRAWWYVDMVMRDAEKFRNGAFQVRDGVGVEDIPEGTGSSQEGEGGIPAGPGSGTEEDFDNCFELLSSVLDEDTMNGLAGGLVARAPDELTQAAVDWALSQKGKPYIWGGTGPVGYDCSGLTMGAYASIGLKIPRVTHDQVGFGEQVPESDVQVGDLIFIDTPASGANSGPPPRHVAMVVDPSAKLMIEARCTLCGPIDVRSWQGSAVYAFTRPLADPSAASLIDSTHDD